MSTIRPNQTAGKTLETKDDELLGLGLEHCCCLLTSVSWRGDIKIERDSEKKQKERDREGSEKIETI